VIKDFLSARNLVYSWDLFLELRSYSDNKIRVYFGNGGAAAVKKLRVEHIMREAVHRLKIKIFGNEGLGLQSFIQLKQTMTTMKIGANCEIKKWSQQFNTFQDYLPRCLWIAGAKSGEWPEAYGEMRKREILEFALPTAYHKTINNGMESYCMEMSNMEGPIMKSIRTKMMNTDWKDLWETKQTMFANGEEMSTDPLEGQFIKALTTMKQPKHILEVRTVKTKSKRN